MDLESIFSDVKPVAQDDGPVPVVKIDYSEDFVRVMGYFRAILVKEEYSERTLQLSEEVIELNAANYSAWQYRRLCMKKMHEAASQEDRLAAWRRELMYCSDQCLNNMKNYQVWFHRRCCIETLHALGAQDEIASELAFIATVLEDDAKNYHAWGHRQWVIKTCGLWAGELTYVDNLLKQDLRNNSAWNQRFFVVSHTADLSDEAVVAKEVEYAIGYIRQAPNNSSAWAYMKGVIEHKLSWERFPLVRQTCEDLCKGAAGAASSAGASGGGEGAKCVQALGMLAEILEASRDAAERKRARACLEELGALDPIRKRYWRWRVGSLDRADAEGTGAKDVSDAAGAPKADAAVAEIQ